MDPPSIRFGQLAIQGFRRLYDVKLELRPLSAIIGANGTGKTSVLDVLSLLASSAQGRLSSSISELSGLSNVLTYDRAGELGLAITMEVPGQEPLEYALWVRPQGIAHAIREETLSQIRKPHPKPFLHIDSLEREVKYYDPEKKKLTHPTWEHNPLETSLAQVPKMFQEPEDFRRRLASSTFYHVLSVEPRSPVRLPQSLGPAELPGRNGEDLFPVSSISNRPTVTGSMQSKIRFAPRFHDLNGWISRRLQRVRWHWHGVSVGFRSRSTRTNCRKELCGSYG